MLVVAEALSNFASSQHRHKCLGMTVRVMCSNRVVQQRNEREAVPADSLGGSRLRVNCSKVELQRREPHQLGVVLSPK